MTPVEAGSTWRSSTSRALATAAQETSVARIPGLPVQALAQPLLASRTCARPAAMRSRATRTGAACTRLVVKTAAAGTGRSATTTPRSRPGRFLMPARIPAKRKPGTRRGDEELGTVRRTLPPAPAAVNGERRGPAASPSGGHAGRAAPSVRMMRA